MKWNDLDLCGWVYEAGGWDQEVLMPTVEGRVSIRMSVRKIGRERYRFVVYVPGYPEMLQDRIRAAYMARSKAEHRLFDWVNEQNEMVS